MMTVKVAISRACAVRSRSVCKVAAEGGVLRGKVRDTGCMILVGLLKWANEGWGGAVTNLVL